MKPYGKDARVEGGGLLETPMPLTLGTLSNSVICTSVPFPVPLTLGTLSYSVICTSVPAPSGRGGSFCVEPV